MNDSGLSLDFTMCAVGILILLGDWLFAVDFPEWVIWLAWAGLIINIIGDVILFLVAMAISD